MLPKTCPVCQNKHLDYEDGYAVCNKCKTYRKKLNFFRRQLVWASDKQWWWRLPILAWFVVMLKQNWKNTWFAINRTSNPFSAFDLGVHELGHIIFSPFGEFMHIAGGCLFQLIFPLLWLFAFWRKKWYFAAAMCWCWLGLNLFDVAAYAGDARARLLPLTAGIAGLAEQGSDEAYDKAHDWYQILSRTHHLNWDLAIEHDLRIAATVAFFIGLAMGSILLVQMLVSQTQRFLKPAKRPK